MEGRLTFLGTGTSMGVPTLGCDCAVCTSADPRDRRLRPSVLLRWNAEAPVRPGARRWSSTPVRISASRPCARRLTHVDAVLYTHSHADHIMGLDDLRPLSFASFRAGGPIPLYAAAADRGGAGARVRLHFFVRVHLSHPRARAHRSRLPTASASTKSNSSACR